MSQTDKALLISQQDNRVSFQNMISAFSTFFGTILAIPKIQVMPFSNCSDARQNAG